MTGEDTIVAISTPPGRGGISVVRLSGPQAIEIACGLVDLAKLPLETQHATRGVFRDPESERVLDEVIVTCFRAPRSYTAEDVVEISCHGAPVLLQYLVRCCLERGARAGEPGEFTMRAFLNGRIDLTQAEAVRDLIESRTLYQARVAATQLEGALSTRLKPHKQGLLELIARLEAGIDFAEDDVPVMDWPEVRARLDSMRTDFEKLVAGYDYGRLVREGLSLAIVGRPNVGKSSLFNRLLNEERAIVTPIPGTTRDLVAESANVGGLPLRFVDTAGIRETSDQVEKIGLEKTFQAIADSDLRLIVVDLSEPWTAQDTDLLARVLPMGPLLIAGNKSDLPVRLSRREVEQALSTLPAQAGSDGVNASVEIVRTCALTGEGVAELKEKILQVAAPAHDQGGELITNLRHQQMLKESVRALERAGQAAEQKLPHEMLLLDLYDALHPLDALTGATYADDILQIVFTKFCVGK